MKTMLWKELRENLKWAVLALLCLFMAELYTLSSQRQSDVEDYRDVTLCSSAFLLATSFGCSAIGAALAAVQVIPELRRDQWAALLHRPVSRSVIFFVKAIAGLMLYLGATTLPLLASALYVAVPGQFAAPFLPDMLRPGLSDLFLGAVFYFATILLCLHRGRWFGSRGAIGLSVVPIFLLHMTVNWPFLLPLAASLIYLLAGWGVMLSEGAGDNRPWAGRAAVVLAMLAGTEMALLTLLFGLSFLPGKSVPTEMNYTNFEVFQDSQVFISSQKGDTSTLTDLNGKVVTDEHYTGKDSGQNACEILPFTWDLYQNFVLRDSYLDRMPRESWSYLRDIDLGQSREVWYLLVKQNYLIGYDKLSRRSVGICDADGFKPAGATPKPFAQPVRDSIIFFRKPHLFWSGTRLHALDFAERSVVTMDMPGDTIWGALNLQGSLQDDTPRRTAVALNHVIRLYDAQGKSFVDVPYPHDPHVWSYLSMGTNETGDRFYLISATSPIPYWKISNLSSDTAPIYLDEIDAQGNVVHTYSRPQDRVPELPPGWTQRLTSFTTPFLPALLGTIHSYFNPPLDITNDEIETVSFPKPLLSPGSAQLIILFLAGIFLALVSLVWARRAGFSTNQSWLWALFVFCFGLPGLVTFRLASDWPTRVTCPECSRPRAIKTEFCAHCSKPWPTPSLVGTEIFDEEKVAIAHNSQ